MAEYVWHHDLKGEAERLRLMSDLLDPSSEFHLSQTGVGMGWRCLEIGAGNGSLSQYFYPTWTVKPPSQKHFWEQFIQWAAAHQIDYYVGRKVPAWLQSEGLLKINSEGHAILYNGGSKFAEWWDYGIREVTDKLQADCGISQATLDEFFTFSRDPTYWTTTIAFTATIAQCQTELD